MRPMSRTLSLLLLVLFLACSGGLWAQDNPAPPVTTAAKGKPPAKTQAAVHKFWDTENLCLFAGVGGARMFDYASTRHLRDQGNNEIFLTNAIVDNRPLFVGIELAGTAASIGVSYLFHRTGHHSLERWTCLVHIGVAVGGAIRNYNLNPPGTSTPPAAAGITFPRGR